MNSTLRIFNYRFYVKELVILFISYLLMEEMFSWLLMPNSELVQNYEKGFSFLVAAYMVYAFPALKTWERVYMAVFVFLMIKLVLQSLYEYNSVFQQLTMFYVLFPVVFALFIKHICRKFDLDILEFLAKFYIVSYLVFMVWYGRGFSFSLAEIEMNDYGPFSGDGRVLHSSKIYMLIIPLLWYFHKFMDTHKLKFFLPLLLCITAIFIHQHRSVWSCSIVALFIYLGMVSRTYKSAIPLIVRIGIGFILLLLVAYFFLANLLPDFVDFMADRFGEIFDPNKEDSTGKFRADQREIYGMLFWERPIFGWSFEGFEMPNPLVDWWPEKSGQHFHEGYMEILFYHGIVGFIFKFSLFAYLIFKAFSRRLGDQTMIVIAFCLSGLLYSFNYVLPLVFWAHLGLCLYYIERDKTALEEEEEEAEWEEVVVR
ncbi:MAG TPA: O-antigen ligase family protein [Flavisolibacter sp.]|nr:O-antigen ligase family protein [Flavisolibacter sp.]